MAGVKHCDHFLWMPRCFCKYSSHRPGRRNPLKEYWAKHAAGLFDRPLLTGINPRHAERCWSLIIYGESVLVICNFCVRDLHGNQLLQGPTWPRLRVEQRRWGGFKQSSPVTRFVTHPYNTSYIPYIQGIWVVSWQLKIQPKGTTKGLQGVNFARHFCQALIGVNESLKALDVARRSRELMTCDDDWGKQLCDSCFVGRPRTFQRPICAGLNPCLFCFQFQYFFMPIASPVVFWPGAAQCFSGENHGELSPRWIRILPFD